MAIKNNTNKKYKVLISACSVSLILHTISFLIMFKYNTGNKVIPAKKNVEVTLVNIKTEQKQISLKTNQIDHPVIKSDTPKAPHKPSPKPNVGHPSRPKNRATKLFEKNMLDKIKAFTNTSQDLNKRSSAISPSNNNENKAQGKLKAEKTSDKKLSIIPKEIPRCLQQCRKPKIPRQAERRGEEGYAVFRLYIQASGKVVKAELLKSSGHTGWNQSARKTALSQIFYPMTKQNKLDILYEMKTDK